MQIHEIIRTRRTALGLTQEQLAGKLGVSAPAVNKWERGNSYPDITLLPVLARTLRVDLNTLLSFREDLTETEIAEFLNRLYEVSRTDGCGAAFSLAEEKLRQFPNSDALAYSAAGLLEGLRFVKARGTERIAAHERRLTRQLAALLKEMPGVEVFFCPDDDSQTAVLSFRAEGWDCEELGETLAARGAAVRAGLHCAPLAHRTAGTLDTGTVRCSFSAFNTAAQVEEFARLLGQTLR